MYCGQKLGENFVAFSEYMSFSKVEFIRSFFGRIHGLTISFRDFDLSRQCFNGILLKYGLATIFFFGPFAHILHNRELIFFILFLFLFICGPLVNLSFFPLDLDDPCFVNEKSRSYDLLNVKKKKRETPEFCFSYLVKRYFRNYLILIVGLI